MKLFSSIKILSENKNIIPENPIKIPNVFTKLNFSFLVKKCPRTVELNGKPIAIFGVVDSHETIPRVGYVWMLGTNEIKDIRSQFLRKCKEQLIQQEEPYEVLTNFVDKRNKVHIKWLRWMGFTIIREGEYYGAEKRTFYEFARIKVNV